MCVVFPQLAPHLRINCTTGHQQARFSSRAHHLSYYRTLQSVMASHSLVLRSLAPLRPVQIIGLVPRSITLAQIRKATTSSLPNNAATPRRRAVTVVSDTGRVPWKELSIGEKAARTTQQSMNLGIVLLGIGMTVGVAAVLYLEVFSSDSKTAVFNRAADRVRKDDRCIQILAGRGHGREIEAYGENSWSRWARNRYIA